MLYMYYEECCEYSGLLVEILVGSSELFLCPRNQTGPYVSP